MEVIDSTAMLCSAHYIISQEAIHFSAEVKTALLQTEEQNKDTVSADGANYTCSQQMASMPASS